jgi:hypothetical protein
MAKITEKRLLAVSPKLLTTNGNLNGYTTIADACYHFVVGQVVLLKSGTQPTLILKVKRIVDPDTVYLGPTDKPVQNYTDISAYLTLDGATLEAEEQNRPSVPEEQIERNTYAEEPAVARRTILVDACGNFIGPDNPLSVDAVLNVGALNINVDLDAKTGDNVAVSAHPSQLFLEQSDTLTTGAYEEIFTYTSANANLKIAYVTAAISATANVRLLINGVVKREYRTSPMDRQAHFLFHEHRSLPTGAVISVEAQLERVLNVPHTTLTALEGYIA